MKNEYEPAVVGVPERTPDDESDRPGGTVDAYVESFKTVHANAGAPPAVNVYE